MNIIIPLGGKGERFSKNGYTQPKPLIQIFEKCMIDYVFDNLTISQKDKVFIIHNTNLDNYGFSKHIREKYPLINLIQIADTSGAAETVFLGIEQIFKMHHYHKKCLLLDCDTFYTEDIVNIFRNSDDNMVFYTKNTDPNPVYSYIDLDNDSIITNIKEKVKISDNANTGAYAFTDIQLLHSYCKHVLDNNITFNNEPYTSCVISSMMKDHRVFKGVELNTDCVISLGTPTMVNQYMDNTYAYLFDLDGTLVITDEIYFDVWSEILLEYNIVLTHEIFSKVIQGNNDNYVVNVLLPNANISISELSNLKDHLFIKNIHKIKTVEGIYHIIEQIKRFGHKICIVTNSNRAVANTIVQHINIDESIDFIISNSNCKRGKPHSEPYEHAIHKYNIHSNKCIVFEDSKSGVLSAKGIHPKLLVGLETTYSSSELIHYGCDISIKNFVDTDIHHFNRVDTQYEANYFKNLIKKNSNMLNISEVLINENKLKGGFIADVISFQIITKDNRTHSQILKYENTNENNLSSMAKKLELYAREYYFYTNISTYINVCIPKFYNLIINENNHICGIVLENLMDKKYEININLNSVSIDVTLTIIDRMARMHSSFWNKPLKQLFPNVKSSNDSAFCPFFRNFIDERYELFTQNWFKILSPQQQEKCNEIYRNFDTIQAHFSQGNHLTFIHGDIKSPNIFYDVEHNYEPYFIDWQHCAIGKGVQDLVFFIIESFDISNIKLIFGLAKQYYYKKLLEYGVTNYSYDEYIVDLNHAICYIPFFTSVWFGTIPQDELIDKNFPYFLINKLFYLLE
jgi:HAD superfamily hydrolase (TIGR01509 family)